MSDRILNVKVGDALLALERAETRGQWLEGQAACNS